MSPSSRRSGWRNHRCSSEPDRWLDELGFYRKHTPRDPSCLFRVVSENVYNTQRFYNRVRMECVQFMASNRELFEPSLSCSFDNYLKEIANPGEWGGLTEIAAMSHLYGRDFVVFEASKCPQTKICNGYDKVIFLYYISDSKHFDAVYIKDHVSSLSYCQSIIYQTLYKGVFEMKGINYAIEKMLYDRAESDHIEYFMAENIEKRKKLKSESKKENIPPENADKNNNAKTIKSCIHKVTPQKKCGDITLDLSSVKNSDVCLTCVDVKDAKSLLENGITPFPYKVAKALDPEVYRNIEFDVWTEWRREIRYGSKYSDGTTLQVGAKCLCRLKPDQKVPNRCHIQQMSAEGGPCLVFVEGIGEMRMVDYTQLEPLPLDEVRPWAPPYRQSRSFSQYLNITQILQQLGNDSRKLGANRLRSKMKQAQDCVSLDGKSLEIDVNSDYNPKINCNEEQFTFDQDYNSQELLQITPWSTNGTPSYCTPDFAQYNQMDFFTFEPYPVEITAMPLKIESRNEAANGASTQQNGPASSASSTPASSAENVPNTQQVEQARASTPSVAIQPQVPQHYPAGGAMVPPMMYNPAMKVYSGVVPIPPNVNAHHPKSINPNGSDLPMNDILTLRFFFNLGLDCFWGGMYPAPSMPPLPRMDINELTQDMQQGLTLQERPMVAMTNGAPPPPPPGPLVPVPAMIPASATIPQPQHKPHHNNKNNTQRPLIGPRFNKRGNSENNHGGTSQNNKGYNSSKGPGHRRGSVPNDNRPEEPPVEPAPPAYHAYPPPLYPMHYYPVEEHPGMMGYGYYVEELDYGVGGYYQPPLAYPPPLPPHLPPHPHHANWGVPQ